MQKYSIMYFWVFVSIVLRGSHRLQAYFIFIQSDSRRQLRWCICKYLYFHLFLYLYLYLNSLFCLEALLQAHFIFIQADTRCQPRWCIWHLFLFQICLSLTSIFSMIDLASFFFPDLLIIVFHVLDAKTLMTLNKEHYKNKSTKTKYTRTGNSLHLTKQQTSPRTRCYLNQENNQHVN